MSVTALGEIFTELGDIAEAIINGLSEHTLIDRTTTTTTTKAATKRKPEITETVVTNVQFSAFHLVFLMVVTGIWTPVRDRLGNLNLEMFSSEFWEWESILGRDFPEIFGERDDQDMSFLETFFGTMRTVDKEFQARDVTREAADAYDRFVTKEKIEVQD